jgi:hypothetical protein
MKKETEDFELEAILSGYLKIDKRKECYYE